MVVWAFPFVQVQNYHWAAQLDPGFFWLSSISDTYFCDSRQIGFS
jgi:hypothetical protein